MKNILVFTFILIFVLTFVDPQIVNLSEMPLNEKIGQMFIVNGRIFDRDYSDLGIGGIFINDLKGKEEYIRMIDLYQNSSKFRLFVATDMEGYWNPFPFFESKNFGDVRTDDEAYELGVGHGEILNELGFNVDFSPVVESKNRIWPGRSFTGNSDEIRDKIKNYILGLHDNDIFATAKHYPGGNMIRDPHWFIVSSSIDEADLKNFESAFESNVSFVMVGHAKVKGALDSRGRQATVSREIIGYLREDFDGLIITDAVSMLGLRWSYFFNERKLYTDLVKAGNDIILDTNPISSPVALKRKINYIVDAVMRGEISEWRIDDSVERILKFKGYETVD